MEIIYIIILYFSWCLGVSFFRTTRGMYGSGTPVPFLILFGILSWQAILVLGFFIIKWYFFVPIIIVFAFGPILTIVNFFPKTILDRTPILKIIREGRPKLDEWTFKNYPIMSIIHIIVAILLWLKYLKYF